MTYRHSFRALLVLLVSLSMLGVPAPGWAYDGTGLGGSDLRMVVIVTRHGVRSPTHPQDLQGNARQPWPTWDVPAGHLTAHGAGLMRQFGSYYRTAYAPSGLFGQSECPAPGSVYIWADVDQRTLATGDALSKGLGSSCEIAVLHADGSSDALFDPVLPRGAVDPVTSLESIEGSIDVAAVTGAYRSEFDTLGDVLGCRTATPTCAPISGIPSTVSSGGDSGLASISGGLDSAATAAENLLLEYTDGKPNPGWGRLDRARLVDLMKLHVLKSRLVHENSYTARVHSSSILMHVFQTLEEGVDGRAVPGTRVPPQAKLAILVGHDTQLSELAGLLHLSWLIQGDQVNDTPPGSALVFELHAGSTRAEPFVRAFFIAQTLDDMRAGNGTRPIHVPLFIPGCPRLDCPLSAFRSTIVAAVDPAFVTPW